jgi:transposase InsO family protein
MWFAPDRTIERLMRLEALRARPRRRRLPKDNGDRQIAAVPSNLPDRQFVAERPNQKWIADFTYIWTAEGWLYAAAVIDLISRRVVGWSMSASMTAQLVADALLMAVWRRGKPCRMPCCITPTRAQPVYQRSVPAADGRQRHRLQHEPIRQCLGQCGHGQLLPFAEDRARRY